MQCFDIYTLFSIQSCDELILLKSRRQIKQTINKYDMLTALILELIFPKNIVIINLSMRIIYKLNKKSKPTFLKIPKPTLNMNTIFFDILNNYKDNLLENKILRNTILPSLIENKHIYYILYNNALKAIGDKYTPKYEKIYTFKDDQIYTTAFLDLCVKKKQIPKLSYDLIKYIGEYVPFIYNIYKVHRISAKCSKCYDRYNAGIMTAYHSVDNSDMCGLCNYKKSKHIIENNILICPSKYPNIICGDDSQLLEHHAIFDAELA